MHRSKSALVQASIRRHSIGCKKKILEMTIARIDRFDSSTILNTKLCAEPSDDERFRWDVEELVQFGEKFKEVLESSVVSNCIDFYIAVDCM